MRIRWNNVIAVPLAISALVYGLMLHRHIGIFFSSLKADSRSYHPPGEIIFGFLAFLAVLLGAIGLIKILFYNGRNT